MPELPEVQTIVSQLSKEIPGLTIRDVWSDWPKMLQVVGDKKHLKVKRNIKKIRDARTAAILEEFKNQVVGKKIERCERKAKNIFIYLTNGGLLLIHQKMTGHLLLGKWKFEGASVIPLVKGPLEEKVNSFIHLIFYLSDGRMLALSDLRKFAKVVVGPAQRVLALPEIAKLGPDPLDKSFRFSEFQSLISKERRKIKQVLMDQEVISGIGNIYSDEILWQAKIHPYLPANKINETRLKEMFGAMKKILKFAIKAGGDSMSDFRNIYGVSGKFQDYHNAYGREGKKCKRCLSAIKRAKLGGRSAHFCPKCQI